MTSAINVYQSPDNLIEPRAQLLVRATPTRRFFTFVIDTICIVILSFVAEFLLWAATQSLGLFIDMEFWGTAYYWPEFIVYLLYYIVMEYKFSATLGKMVVGTRVVDEFGGKPAFRQIVIRTLCRNIPFEPLSIYFSAELKCWHDSLSGTQVSRKKV